MKTAFYDIIFSEDDGGYYAEIFRANGEELHTTELADDRSMAKIDVHRWCKANDCGPQRMGNVAYIPTICDN